MSLKTRLMAAALAVPLCFFAPTLVFADGEESLKDMPASPLSRWTGFYVGGQIGHGNLNFDGVFDIGEDDFDNRAFANNLDLSGFVGGIHVGYNLQHGSIVYGVEGDFNWLDQDDRSQDVDSADFVTGEVEYLATIRGRLGLTNNHVLVYGTAGVAFVDSEYTAVNAGGDGSSGSLDFNETGWVVGGGAEFALTQNFSLRAQGLYYDFGEKKDGSNLNDDSDPGDFAEIEDAYTFTVGATYKLW